MAGDIAERDRFSCVAGHEPASYVGTEVEDLDDEVFEEKLAAARVELRELAARAAKLEASVDSVLSQLLQR